MGKKSRFDQRRKNKRATLVELAAENDRLQEENLSLINENRQLFTENFRLKKKLRELRPPHSRRKRPKINGWNIVLGSDGFYRGFKRIDGKTRSVYIGKFLTSAKGKIQKKLKRLKHQPHSP